jgi:hypothetical protein
VPATEAASARRPPSSTPTACPACSCLYAIKGADLIHTYADCPESEVVAGKMLVCANCGQSYMSTAKGAEIPRMAFGYQRRPAAAMHEAAAPREHRPESGNAGTSEDPLRWTRGR